MTLTKPAASSWIAIALALAYVVAFWSDPIGPHVWSPLGWDMLHGDSQSFFFTSPRLRDRTLGYPFFVEAVRVVFGTVEAVQRVQLVVMAASVVFMGWAVGRAASRGGTGGKRTREGAVRSVSGGGGGGGGRRPPPPPPELSGLPTRPPAARTARWRGGVIGADRSPAPTAAPRQPAGTAGCVTFHGRSRDAELP